LDILENFNTTLQIINLDNNEIIDDRTLNDIKEFCGHNAEMKKETDNTYRSDH
jgi:hypothetical protein